VACGADGVVIDVDDPGPGRHLVRAALGGQPAAEVEELVDPGAGDMTYGTLEEGPVRAGQRDRLRDQLGELVDGLAVDREVVLPAQHVVVHACGMRLLVVELPHSIEFMSYPAG
jgi:hypothetical protein